MTSVINTKATLEEKEHFLSLFFEYYAQKIKEGVRNGTILPAAEHYAEKITKVNVITIENCDTYALPFQVHLYALRRGIDISTPEKAQTVALKLIKKQQEDEKHRLQILYGEGSDGLFPFLVTNVYNTLMRLPRYMTLYNGVVQPFKVNHQNAQIPLDRNKINTYIEQICNQTPLDCLKYVANGYEVFPKGLSINIELRAENQYDTIAIIYNKTLSEKLNFSTPPSKRRNSLLLLDSIKGVEPALVFFWLTMLVHHGSPKYAQNVLSNLLINCDKEHALLIELIKYSNKDTVKV